MSEARKKILCIEDDPEVAKLIAEELSERGFNVVIAYDGQTGFIAILKGIPDLVLCDVGLPKMSGLEVLKHLNELLPRSSRIPFVFLTALSDRYNELLGRDLGADDYIAKPIDFDALETVVRARLIDDGVRHEISEKLPKLNDREAEALSWIARGKTSLKIAELLDIPKQTIDSHLENARFKLGAVARTEAAVKASTVNLSNHRLDIVAKEGHR